MLAAEKAEIIEDEEESDGVYIARQIFAEIQKIQVNDDEIAATLGKCMLERNGKYLLISDKIEEIIESHKYKITTNRLSPIMANLHMKTKGTKHPRLNKKETRVWEFYPENFKNSTMT